MNYLYIGILSIAAIIIIGLGIKLAITKANIKKKKELAAKRKELLAKRDHEIMEDTAKILEKLLSFISETRAKEEVERKIVLEKLYDLRQNKNIGDFGVKHFISIHKPKRTCSISSYITFIHR